MTGIMFYPFYSYHLSSVLGITSEVSQCCAVVNCSSSLDDFPVILSMCTEFDLDADYMHVEATISLGIQMLLLMCTKAVQVNKTARPLWTVHNYIKITTKMGICSGESSY